MSFETYAKFTKADSPITLKNVTNTPDADLIKQGQDDGVTPPNQPSKWPAKSGWWRCLLWNYSAAANFNANAGVSTGNITDTFCTVLKYQGEASAYMYRAMFTRSVFNLEINVTEKLGNGENVMNSSFKFSNCVFTKMASATGNPLNVLANGGTTSTTVEYTGSDTKELDVFTIVYQSVLLNTFGKEATASLMGKTK